MLVDNICIYTQLPFTFLAEMEVSLLSITPGKSDIYPIIIRHVYIFFKILVTPATFLADAPYPTSTTP